MSTVGCAGLLVEDSFCGPVASLPPEGALVVLDNMPVRAGGCAANVAISLARQGISVEVSGCVGFDSGAEVLRSAFTSARVGSSRVVAVGGPCTSKTIILLIDGQDRRYFHVIGANRSFSVEHLPISWLATLKIFYLGGLCALPGIDFDRLRYLLKECRDRRVTTVVDVVAPQDSKDVLGVRSLLPYVDVFVPNEDESRAITELTDPVDQLRAFQDAGANTVIVTRGGNGCVALYRGETYSCGAYQMDVVDPSGSGDAFTSGIIASLLRGSSISDTLQYASAMGASATRAAGTTDSVFSVQQAQAFIAAHPLTVTRGT